ncbi:PepSY domain-containing protein [Carboxylicivirga sp. N1Y90]|uniref:PepSY domain-containing protein n=1 Tax=Carboxylicivirga fragile TaxID=3417571 RepID=UPI003D33932D|nr:PepSY domain-containing protein [Marinilabiliaceae bacterium N1Y90]
MSLFRKILLQIHKITGSFLSLLFVMWCVSGIVLIYVGFPHASRQQRFEHLDYIRSADFSKIQPLPAAITGKVELEKYPNTMVYRVYKGKKAQKVYNAQTLEAISVFNRNDAIKMAESFANSSVQKVDSMVELDSWIPWRYYEPLLPFYKCYMNDEARTVVYVSSVSGLVVQKTDQISRWMGRIGAIPHWIYFKQLHTKAQLRKQVVVWLGILSLIACISGLWFGIYRLKRNDKQVISGITVYKKWWYKWHHISGFVFGIVMSTFILSGIFYTTGVPDWMVENTPKSPLREWNKGIKSAPRIAPHIIWNQLRNQDGVRKIAWASYMNTNVVEVYYQDYKNPIVYRFNDKELLEPIQLGKDEVMNYAKSLFGSEISLSVQNDYDYYYEAQGMFHRPIPAFKIELNNLYNTCLFVNPNSGKAVYYLDNNKRSRRWLAKALHKFDFPVLKSQNKLRISLLILALLGGLFLSISSVVLGVKWFKRVIK